MPDAGWLVAAWRVIDLRQPGEATNDRMRGASWHSPCT